MFDKFHQHVVIDSFIELLDGCTKSCKALQVAVKADRKGLSVALDHTLRVLVCSPVEVGNLGKVAVQLVNDFFKCRTCRLRAPWA